MLCCDMAWAAGTVYRQRTGGRIRYGQTRRTLIKALYASLLRLKTGNPGMTAPEIATEGDAMNLCDELYEWYAARYVPGDRETQNRGISKNVSFKNTYNGPLSQISVYRMEGGKQVRSTKNLYGTYYFHEPYEKRQFEKYLVRAKAPARNEDFLAFILHMAVAFLLETGELDAILKEYGFQPLHVRNIHHLAIYTTLSEYRKGPNPREAENPFDQVKRLYDQARDVLNGESGERKVFGQDHTQWIRERLFLEGELKKSSYLSIIQNNTGSFTMRHRTILDDHHKFASVFRFLLTDSGEGDPRKSSGRDYSFYAFTDSFCCAHSEKKFREKLFDQIDKYGKHPTRELMICFWLYTLCFAYTDGVYVGDNALAGMVRKLGQYDRSWAAQIPQFCDCSYLNVSGFLSGRRMPKKTVFRGADLVDFIRAKLRDHYHWGTLDSRNDFDYYIEQLKDLDFQLDFNDRPADIRFRGLRVAFDGPFPDEVPGALVVVFEFFRQLKAYTEYPLECSMYEQI